MASLCRHEHGGDNARACVRNPQLRHDIQKACGARQAPPARPHVPCNSPLRTDFICTSCRVFVGSHSWRFLKDWAFSSSFLWGCRSHPFLAVSAGFTWGLCFHLFLDRHITPLLKLDGGPLTRSCQTRRVGNGKPLPLGQEAPALVAPTKCARETWRPVPAAGHV